MPERDEMERLMAELEEDPSFEQMPEDERLPEGVTSVTLIPPKPEK